MRKIERQTDGVEKLHDMEFSRRLDLVLPRDRAPRVVLMFIFVYSDDKSCDPAAISSRFLVDAPSVARRKCIS